MDKITSGVAKAAPFLVIVQIIDYGEE